MHSRLLLRLSPLLGVLVLATTTISGRPESSNTVLFLCPYGGAKSVIAAVYFNRLAKECALPLTAVAAASEEPYEGVPLPVAALLAQDGIDVATYPPRRVRKEDFSRALRVVAIDCDLPKTDSGSVLAERWDDVPKVSEDLPGAIRSIRRHVEKLVQELTQAQPSRFTWADDARTCIPP